MNLLLPSASHLLSVATPLRRSIHLLSPLENEGAWQMGNQAVSLP